MNKIVLSMTSYGERLKILHTHLNWVKQIPFLFNLYVGDNEVLHPELIKFFETIPNAQLHIVKDIGPLTKSYYALQDFPDDIIFIIDDDLLYTPQWINFAVDSYYVNSDKFYNCIIGLVARKIIINPEFKLEIMQFGKDQSDYQKSLNYFTGHAKPYCPSYTNIILSGSPGSFLNIRQVHSDFFDKDTYLKLSKSQDEIWTWCHAVRAGYKEVSLHTARIAIPSIPETVSSGLCVNYNTISHESKIFDDLLNKYPDTKRNLILN